MALLAPTTIRLSPWRRLAARIGGWEHRHNDLDEAGLKRESRSLKYRAAAGESLDRLLPEAYALARLAGQRALGMRHYDVQILGGIALHHNCVAEMQTGEGKTLTAVLPLYLAALAGEGAHLATANDYLARRDAEWMQPLYKTLGLTVGLVEASTPQLQRKRAYECDITYGTAREFGFDFLRDCLAQRSASEGGDNLLDRLMGSGGASAGQQMQRPPYFALVDEADSLLIDEAGTPLVISATSDGDDNLAELRYRWAAEVASRFEQDEHFEYDSQRRSVTLTATGRRLVRTLPKREGLEASALFDLYEHVERAIKVRRDLLRDRHYVVQGDEVIIVDEFTGRLADGRRWRGGLHQAVEAAEDLPIRGANGQAARVTVQDYFRRYPRLAGMTGTAAGSARELRKIYEVRLAVIPTNRPPRRQRLAAKVFGTAEQKWRAMVEEVSQTHATGQPMLIGTRSIDKSEHLAALLAEAGIQAQVLNARHVAAEAEIVAGAGQRGRVTVATNMAGRGTDIKLAEDVLELGGMHVLCSELHDSARIDRQLIGRSGRQGDPGSYRQYLALDDDILLTGLGPQRAERLRKIGEAAPAGESLDRFAPLFAKAQARVERRQFRQRQMLMYRERQQQQAQRKMGLDPYLDSPD